MGALGSIVSPLTQIGTQYAETALQQHGQRSQLATQNRLDLQNLRAQQAHEARMAQAQFDRELALERERTRRAWEIYGIENPPAEAEPGLVRQRLDTLADRQEARGDRRQALAAAQASARTRAAASGSSGGTSAKAIQRNLIETSKADGRRQEQRFAARLQEQDKRHARNLLDAENRRRRAILGLTGQLEPRG
jgi:hypothetical protein